MNTKIIKQKLVDMMCAISFGWIIMTPVELFLLHLPVESWLKMRIGSIVGNIFYGIVYGIICNICSNIRNKSARKKFWFDTIVSTIFASALYFGLLTYGGANKVQIRHGMILVVVIAATTGALYGWWQDLLRKTFNVKTGLWWHIHIDSTRGNSSFFYN